MSLYSQDRKALFQNVESSFTYTGDIFTNISGGLETGVRYMDNIDVEVGFDIKGLSFYFYGLWNQGKSISEIVVIYKPSRILTVIIPGDYMKPG